MQSEEDDDVTLVENTFVEDDEYDLSLSLISLSVRLGRARSGSVRKTTGTTTMTNKSRYDNVRSFFTMFHLSLSSSSSSSSFREDLKTNEEEEEEEEEEVDAGKAMRTTRRACVLKSGVVATSGFWIVENRRARAEDERNMAEDYDAIHKRMTIWTETK